MIYYRNSERKLLMSNYNYGLEPGIGHRTGSSKLRFVMIFLFISAITAAVLWYFLPEREKKTQKGDPAAVRKYKDSAVSVPDVFAAEPAEKNMTSPGGSIIQPAQKETSKGISVVPQSVKKETADTGNADPVDPPLPDKGVITSADMAAKDLPVIAADGPVDPAKENLLKRAEVLLKKGELAEAEILLEQALVEVKENTAFYRKAWKCLSALRVRSIYQKNGTRWNLLYRIKAGDTLSGIASKHRTTVELIRKCNKISGSRIYVGRALWLTPGDWRIAVSKNSRLLKLYHLNRDKKETLWGVWEVGVGRMGKTPSAEFAISSRVRHPDWYLPDGRVFKYGEPENQLGEYFLKLAPVNAPGRPLLGYGIHGAKDESVVGRSLSNGCVRMKNVDVEAVFYLVPSGTRVVISEN